VTNSNSNSGNDQIRLDLLINHPTAVPTVAKWWFDQWGHFQLGAGIDDWISDIHDALSNDEIRVYVIAILGDEVVGAAILKNHEMRDKFPDKRYWLGNVYVADTWRGHGIAAALVRKIIRIANEKRISALHLQTLHLDGGLCARLGWQRIDQVTHLGNEVCVMVRPISGD